MSDVAVQAADVRASAGATVDIERAGVNGIEPGDALYKRAGDSKVLLLDSNTGDPAKAAFYGYAQGYADADDYFAVQTDGDIYLGVDVDEGEIYTGSSNPGGTAPCTDAYTGSMTSIIGVGTDLGFLRINKYNSGFTRA
jgi:hypothetical protein